jgi:FMN phosphatase YigB (HAD superfamily)
MRNVVFDVGGVLVELRYRSFVSYLTAAGAQTNDLAAWARQVGLESHERGEIAGEEFLERIARSVRAPLDRDELRGRWLDMFEQAQAMFALARSLMADHRVYLLSNVGDLHWAHLDAAYGVARLGHGALPSFRAGATKPDESIYRAAEAAFELDPASTVFIDDLSANVAGARARGWAAIEHRDHAATCAALRRLGVRVPPEPAEGPGASS